MPRNDAISALKAIGILLMVWWHAKYFAYGGIFITMFHLCAGYCMKDDYLTDAWTFVKKRFKGLYLPYIGWGIVFLLCHNLFFRLNIYHPDYSQWADARLYSVQEIAKRLVQLIGMNNKELLLGPYWFLRTLLFGSLLGYMLLRLIRRPWAACAVALLLAVLASHFGWGWRNWTWGLGKADCLAALFFLCGYWYRKSGWHVENSAWIIIIGMAGAAVGVRFCSNDMFSVSARQMIPFVVTASLGTFVVFAAAVVLMRGRMVPEWVKRTLRFFGDHTLAVLTFHLLCFKLVNLCIISAAGLPMERLAEFPVMTTYAQSGWWVLYLLVGAGLPALFVRLLQIAKATWKRPSGA